MRKMWQRIYAIDYAQIETRMHQYNNFVWDKVAPLVVNYLMGDSDVGDIVMLVI